MLCQKFSNLTGWHFLLFSIDVFKVKILFLIATIKLFGKKRGRWWLSLHIVGKGKLRACLGKVFSSLNFHHSSLITRYSSLIFSHSFGNITFIFITQFFHTIHGSHTCQQVHFFFLVPNSPKLILKKKKKQTANANPGKKKVKRWSKVAAVDPLCVFNYNIAIELWVMETENSQKLLFSVSITHNSKIRESNNGNRVMATKLLFVK